MDASTPIPTSVRNVELTLEHDGETLITTPVQRLGDDLDAALASDGAESWCFVPLFDLEDPLEVGSKARLKREKKFARAITELGVSARPGTLTEATLREDEDEPRSAPGVFLFDLRRSDVRALAKELSVSWFYWGRPGTLTEAHGVEPIDELLWSFDGSVFRAARRGLLDFLATAARSSTEPVLRRSLLVLTIAVAATLAVRAGVRSFFPEGVDGEWYTRITANAALLPALAVWYLLASFVQRSDAEPSERDLTHEEVESRWDRVAPDFARYWIVGGLAALVAGIMSELAAEPPEHVSQGLLSLGDGMRAAVLCLWLASASAWSSDFWDAVGQGFEQWWEFFVWVLVISIIASVGDRIVDGIFNFGMPYVPLPVFLETTLSVVGKLASKAFLYGHLLGIGWLRFRESYMHWLESQEARVASGAEPA